VAFRGNAIGAEPICSALCGVVQAVVIGNCAGLPKLGKGNTNARPKGISRPKEADKNKLRRIKFHGLFSLLVAPYRHPTAPPCRRGGMGGD
jgi:hypothetical protein